MDLTFESLPDNPCTLFAPFADRDEVRVVLETGEVLVGSYMPMIGQHYLSCPQRSVHGPFTEGEVRSVALVRSREDIASERFERTRGEPVPGTFRRDRDGFQARLERIARLVARTEDKRRERELRLQFDDVADEIELAKTKRKWMFCEAYHSLSTNAPLRKRDLDFGDLYSLAKVERPRPQDFDPDPKVRRARVPVPHRDQIDPRSTPNMLKALREAGFKVGVSMAGEILEDEADLFVVFPGGKNFGRYALRGERGADGAMAWTYAYHDNDTKAAEKRRLRCLYGQDLPRFRAIVAAGLSKTEGHPE